MYVYFVLLICSQNQTSLCQCTIRVLICLLPELVFHMYNFICKIYELQYASGFEAVNGATGHKKR